MNLSLILASHDPVLWGVFIILMIMSIGSWAILLAHLWRRRKIRQEHSRFGQLFWQAENLNAAQRAIEGETSPMAQAARSVMQANENYFALSRRALHEAIAHDDFLTREIRNACQRVLRPFDFGLSWLASTGATAPFIGLFGTVWGIYHALINIGQTGQMTIAAVATPIGEALVATAAGLFVAVPAVLFYNILNRANRNLSRQMMDFAHDLHVQLLNHQISHEKDQEQLILEAAAAEEEQYRYILRNEEI